jgi:serine/threonine protein kinase
MLNPQHILNGRYQLRQQLGQNAGRQTWLAEDLETQPQELVVVKLLAFSPQMQWEEFRLFEREAQVLQHLDHPRIPRYRDYFSIEETEFELPWFGLVQQYIPGLSLRQRLDQGHSFSEAEAQKIATDILTILIYLHELSPPVLHRDIKPSNLIVDEQGQVYLVDFGAVQDRAKAEGATFTVVGTSGYAAPEQLWGRAVAASDLYSLGATLIHLVTGIAPADLPQQNLRLQFADRVNLNPRFSYWLEKLIDPATEQRFSSARQALEALTAAVAPEASTTSQPSISPVTVLSVIAVLIAVVTGGISIYFSIANSFKKQQIKAN